MAVAGDHTSLALKAAIVQHLRGRGIAAHDLGTDDQRPGRLSRHRGGRGACRWRAAKPTPAIVIDGAGLGSTIAANKVPGVRAAMCLNETLARYARQHNGANVLALGVDAGPPAEALAIVDTFIDTPMREARYIRRLAKIRDARDAPARR